MPRTPQGVAMYGRKREKGRVFVRNAAAIGGVLSAGNSIHSLNKHVSLEWKPIGCNLVMGGEDRSLLTMFQEE